MKFMGREFVKWKRMQKAKMMANKALSILILMFKKTAYIVFNLVAGKYIVVFKEYIFAF